MSRKAEANYEIFIEKNVLVIIDHNIGAKSVTNDIENVLSEIRQVIWSDIKLKISHSQNC